MSVVAFCGIEEFLFWFFLGVVVNVSNTVDNFESMFLRPFISSLVFILRIQPGCLSFVTCLL